MMQFKYSEALPQNLPELNERRRQNALKTNPQPIELQQKLERLGWGEWKPTPGVTDEDKELYITLGDRHVHIMSCVMALALSDAELQRRIEEAMGMTFEQAWEQHDIAPNEIKAKGSKSHQPEKEELAHAMFCAYCKYEGTADDCMPRWDEAANYVQKGYLQEVEAAMAWLFEKGYLGQAGLKFVGRWEESNEEGQESE